jgi:DNA polymerase-3 subunit gamma/tau
MENFIVSARKYRPAKFLDVVGQEQVSETLKKALSSGKLAQSFLFCGPRGVGKTTCARILAKAINCANPNADFEPCGECNSCKSFNTNSSFNIFELDAASNSGVAEMKELIDTVRFPPQDGKYKVYILDEVHMLSPQAFNAFLKTLEEPPSYAIFILATTEKHKIIPTILSRCQIFDFKRISDKDIVKQLQKICDSEGVTAEPSALHVIAQKADGGLRDALSLFDKIVSYAGKKVTYQDVITNLNILDHDYYFKITESFMVEDSSAVLNAFSEIINNGFEGEMFLLGLAEHFRNLLISKDERTVQLLEAADDIKDKYFKQANLVNETFLLNALNVINQCDIEYKTAKNKRLHVELALLKVCFLNTQIESSLYILLGEKKN